ncbi:hypothetical protein A2U01_0067670, partial [Trifolium medium]|nr:hypothetical protein [Trifolium medium]
ARHVDGRAHGRVELGGAHDRAELVMLKVDFMFELSWTYRWR